jgi:Tfp pilus assembly protein PilV
MRLATARNPSSGGFTLAEVMAAMLFLAVVVPVAVEVLHLSTLAGEVAVRKSVAARVADRILSESLVTTNWSNGAQSGTVTEGTLDLKWKLFSAAWPEDSMQLLTAEVTFSAQGKDYAVKMSTLANLQNQAQPAGANTTQ